MSAGSVGQHKVSWSVLMGSPKGVRVGGGSRKGIPNKATKDVREAIAKVAQDRAVRFQGWIDRVAMTEGQPRVAAKYARTRVMGFGTAAGN
jgi:hypothetical protein